MSRWLFAIGAALLTAAGAWLMLLNPEPVRVQYTPHRVVELPLAQALIAAFALGAGVITLLASARGVGRGWRAWRLRRRHAKHARTAAATEHARSLVWAGAYDQARLELGVVKDEATADAERIELAAESYLAEGNLPAARALLDRAVKRFGTQPRLLDLRATAAERSGDLAGAIATLELLRPTLGGTPRLARRLRDLYVAAERYEDAMAVQSDLLLGLRRGPALAAEERQLVGLRYALACRDRDARRGARRLAAIARQAPEFAPAFVAAGDRWQAAGKPSTARRIWERGVVRHPVQPLLDRLATHYQSGGDPDRLARLYERLGAAHPNAPELLLRRVRALIAAERVDDADGILGSLAEPLASWPAVHVLRAQLAARRGQSDEAARHLDVAWRETVERLPHRCTACLSTIDGWRDRCPACGAWGSFDVTVAPPVAAGPSA